MLLRWMIGHGYEPRDLTRVGVATLLVALFVETIGSLMNRALDTGAERFMGMPLNEAVYVAVLLVGGVLMGLSIVFNVVGIRERRRGR